MIKGRSDSRRKLSSIAHAAQLGQHQPPSPHAGTALRMANRGNAEFGKFGNNSYFQTSPLISHNTAFPPRPLTAIFSLYNSRLTEPYRLPTADSLTLTGSQGEQGQLCAEYTNTYSSLQHVRIVSSLKDGRMSGNVLLVL